MKAARPNLFRHFAYSDSLSPRNIHCLLWFATASLGWIAVQNGFTDDMEQLE